MNIKKTAAGLMVGFALIGSVAAPSALAVDIGGGTTSANATVDISDGGVFDTYFCDGFTLNQQTAPTAGSAGYAQGSLSICYTDTKTHRANFDVTLTADDFTSTTTSNVIPASNAKVVYTYNVAQGQWDSVAGFDVGDIGYFQNNDYVGQNPAGAPWTSANQLSTSPTVNFGYEGVGTIWSRGDMEIGLTIPKGTQAGIYTSQFTLSVITGTQP